MPNLSLVAAFVAGLLSFLNPCVLPLIPGFLGYLSGISLLSPVGSRFKIFLNSLFFVLGFSVVFALLGVLISVFVHSVSFVLKIWLTRVGGLIIILFGLHLMGLIKLGWLEKEHKLRLKSSFKPSYFLSFLFGAIFAAGWTPCVGAILGGVLALAVTSPVSSFMLLLLYAFGLGLPFLVVGAFSSWAFKLIQRSSGVLKYFNIFSGLFLAGLGLVVLVGSIKPLPPVPSAVAKKYTQAKEFISPDGYINTSNFKLSDFIGKKVILLDFWTYSCVNCQRTFPYLRAWHERYKNEGLVIIGIHSPEFEFEKDYKNVSAAVKKYGITYPVILDNRHANLNLYDTIYWPTEMLIDINGLIVYKHVGEGGYEETELEIRKLLGDSKKENINKPSGAVDVNFWQIETPEIYFGSKTNRGYFGNLQGFSYKDEIDYKMPSDLKMNEIYLEGLWYNDLDNLELRGERGRIALIFKAKSVNIVAGSLKGDIRVNVTIDGEKSYVIVNKFDLYNIFSGKEYAKHKLELEIEGSGLAAYAMTFG